MSNTLLKERNLGIAEEVVNIAQEIKRTPFQVALNWIRQSKMNFQNKIMPIIGAKNLVQINDNLSCMEFVLPDDHILRLNEISKIELGFPYDFFSSDIIKNIIYGGTFSSIYNSDLIIQSVLTESSATASSMNDLMGLVATCFDFVLLSSIVFSFINMPLFFRRRLKVIIKILNIPDISPCFFNF